MVSGWAHSPSLTSNVHLSQADDPLKQEYATQLQELYDLTVAVGMKTASIGDNSAACQCGSDVHPLSVPPTFPPVGPMDSAAFSRGVAALQMYMNAQLNQKPITIVSATPGPQ
jgi:hypothetical protein